MSSFIKSGFLGGVLMLAFAGIAHASVEWKVQASKFSCRGALLSKAQTFALQPEFNGEEKFISYFSKEERQRFRPFFGPQSIRFRDENGKFSELIGSGLRVMYVMSVSGEIYLDPKDRGPHSAILAGAPVVAAGYIRFHRDGSIVIDNESGHYKPAAESLAHVVQALVGRGVAIETMFLNWYVLREG